MENNRRQKAKSTGDMFTFPSLSKDLDFEHELADHLFANGRFRVHAFPIQPTNILIPKSVILSRTSSFSSKGSLLSSRSDSTSSGNSSNSNSNSDSSRSSSNSSSKSNSKCNSARKITSEASSRRSMSTTKRARYVAVSSNNSNSNSNSKSTNSARTSTSEASSRRKLSTISARTSTVAAKSTNTSKRVGTKEWQTRNYVNEYGHSQRWQFISPVPVLNRRSSLNKMEGGIGRGGKGKRDADDGKGVCQRFFGWLVSTCQECHAIEPSKRLKVSM